MDELARQRNRLVHQGMRSRTVHGSLAPNMPAALASHGMFSWRHAPNGSRTKYATRPSSLATFQNAEKDEGDERLPRSIEESRRRLVDAKRGRNERPFKRNERSLCLPLRTAQQAFRAVE